MRPNQTESLVHARIGRASFMFLTGVAIFAFGCAPGSIESDEYEDIEEEGADEQRDEIIGGTVASAYPEAVLIGMKQNGVSVAICSGAVIAPKVILTAGHCVYGYDGWTITAPFASGQKANGVSGKTYDWANDSEYVDPNQHDVGLIILDKAINLSSYPTVKTTPITIGSKVQNIGRINNGTASYSKLYIGPPVTTKSGKNYGFPYDDVTAETIQSGDSGGPVVVPGTHTIVAVNSGSGGGTQVLARTDLLANWIKQEVDKTNAAPPAPTDPCNGITYEGTCKSGSVVWCENNKLNQINCSASGATCGWDASGGYYNCL